MLVNILGLTLGFVRLLIVLLYLNDEQSYNTNNPNKEVVYDEVQRMIIFRFNEHYRTIIKSSQFGNCYRFFIVNKGKSKKLTLIAVSNKLLKQAYGISKSGLPYDKNYVSKLT